MSTNTRKGEVKRLVVVVIAIVLLLAVIGGTYSKYTSGATGSGTVAIAKWDVEVNGEDMGTTSATFDLTFTAENNNTVANKIAPGGTATAYVDVTLTGTEVSVDFACALAENSAALTTAFGSDYADKITVAVGTPVLQSGAENMTLSGNSVTVGTAAMSGTVRIPITLTWTDAAANNTADTTTGLGQTGVTIPVTLTVSQKI